MLLARRAGLLSGDLLARRPIHHRMRRPAHSLTPQPPVKPSRVLLRRDQSLRDLALRDWLYHGQSRRDKVPGRLANTLTCLHLVQPHREQVPRERLRRDPPLLGHRLIPLARDQLLDPPPKGRPLHNQQHRSLFQSSLTRHLVQGPNLHRQRRVRHLLAPLPLPDSLALRTAKGLLLHDLSLPGPMPSMAGPACRLAAPPRLLHRHRWPLPHFSTIEPPTDHVGW